MHFNLESNPAYFVIPSYLAKNNAEREVFITPETKAILEDYLKNNEIKDPEQFIFFLEDPPKDEEGFQKALKILVIRMTGDFERVLKKPAFKHLNIPMMGRRKAKRYKTHLYSVKKTAFSKFVEALGDTVARAMLGQKAYLITYFKKTREERIKDFQKLIPKLSVISPTDLEAEKKRSEIQASIQGLSKDQLDAILKLIKAGKGSS